MSGAPDWRLALVELGASTIGLPATPGGEGGIEGNAMQNVQIAGSCRCGQVQFAITRAPLLTMACHCVGCQKMSSSAFSLSAAIPTEGFRVTSGDPVIGGLHGASRHYFCPFCMSWLFTKPEEIDLFASVRPTMLMGPAWTEPFIETCTLEKLDWVSTPARHSYPTFPPPEAYERLMAEFAAQETQAGRDR